MIFGHKDAKKKAQAKKARFNQEFFNFIRMSRAEEKRVDDLKKAAAPKRAIEGKWTEKEVGDKVAVMRNKLTGQKRVSKERWNRFAGTSGGGGRGL